MLENQFIQFSRTIDPLKHEIAMPIRPNDALSFIEFDLFGDITFVTPDGSKEIGSVNFEMDSKDDNFICHIKGYSGLAPQDKFRIKLYIGGDTSEYAAYSNLLINDPQAELSSVKYACNENAFGFIFGKTDNENDIYIQHPMPINIHSPQFKQEDKIYTKLNGEQVVLYATVSREYEGETDYIPEEWHKKIIAALSCDKVYINGERVTKSGSYDIDWEKCDTACDGTKLARATFKVSDNIMQRNSNY